MLELATLRENFGLSPCLEPSTYSIKQDDRAVVQAISEILFISARMVDEFFRLAAHKYQLSSIEPGTAVGAVGAQSIGEPGTQVLLFSSLLFSSLLLSSPLLSSPLLSSPLRLCL